MATSQPLLVASILNTAWIGVQELVMQSIEEILNAVRNLPARDRARLMHELRTLSPESTDTPENASDNGPYSGLLALAGTAHTDFDDVCSDKHKHLGEIHAGQHEHE